MRLTLTWDTGPTGLDPTMPHSTPETDLQGFHDSLFEESRLAIVQATGLGAPGADPDLERYARFTRQLLRTSACYISITDHRHVFVKSAAETALSAETRRQDMVAPDVTCAYVALSGRPLAIRDMRLDARFAKHAEEASPGLFSYLGVPLLVRGRSIGAICVLDDSPRDWLERDLETLGELAETTGKWIELLKHAELSALMLEEREIRYRAITEDAPLIAFQASADGHLLYVNRYTETFTGLPLAELCGLKWLECVRPECRNAAAADWRRILQSGQAGGMEYPLRCADGCYRTLHLRAQPVKSSDGRVLYWVGIGIDVEERKLAEAQVLMNQNRFMMALDAGQLGFWDWNIATNGVVFAGHWGSILGYELDELAPDLGTWERLIHPQDEPGVRALLRDHLAGRTEYYESEHRLRHRNGGWRWVLDRGRVVERTPDGRPLRALGTHADITKRKEAELALLLSEGHTQLAMEIAAVASWDTDLFREETHWSRSLCTMLGYEPTTLGPSPLVLWRELVPEEDFETVSAEWERAARERDVFRCEHRMRRVDDGSLLWVDTAGRFFFDQAGRAERFVGVCVDITARKQAEAVLQDSARRKDEFLAMLAHELRNPLAPILNAVELLRETVPATAAGLGPHAVIERQVRQLVHLVDDLLDVSRVSRGRIALKKAQIRLADVVQHAAEATRSLLDARGHSLHLHMPTAIDDVIVHGDFTRLTQVVSNLLNNAAKYTDRGGRIDLVLARNESSGEPLAEIRVRDNGRGIDPPVLGSVFDLFYQADNSLDRAEGGLGIGLSLVKRLVENHGGRVTGHSAGRGRGSEFVVRLPCIDGVRGVANDGHDARTPRPTKSTRILVVDDNRDATDSLALLLEMHGHDVISAYEGRAALELVAREKPSVVLLDIGLPDLDGFEIARQLRADPRTADVVLIALTGYGQAEDRENSRLAGFDHHLVKPAGVARILALVPA
jgi:PAS domain S-box-containing protein